MRISIIKSNKIQNIMLPDKIEGSYWIKDTDSNGIERNLILIEAEDNKWKLISNQEVYYISDNSYQPFIYLNLGMFYSIKNTKDNNDFVIYCSDSYTSYNYYEIPNSDIFIGNYENSNIRYSLFNNGSVVLKQINGSLYIIDDNCPYGIYVNNIRINKQKVLNPGDMIFIAGLKLIYIIYECDGYINSYIGVSKLDNCIVNLSIVDLPLISPIFNEPEEEIEFVMYEDKDYFHKTPRFVYSIKPLVLQVDAPPNKVEEPNTSVLLTIGPMLTMSMMSLVTGYTALSGVLSGESTWGRAAPSLVICVAMFASVFIWPFFNKWYSKKNRIKNEQLRQEKYSKYIESKRQLIVEARKDQSKILWTSYPGLKEVQDVILGKYTTLWQKKREDEDFLTVSLGIGSYPMKIDIKYPEEHFSMIEDNLKDMVISLSKEPKILPNVPVLFSFSDNYISGLIGESNTSIEFMKTLILQLLAYHSYDDLKIILLTDEENSYNWEFLKDAPHCFSNDKKIRFFGTNSDEYKEICYYLDNVFNSRKEKIGNGKVNASEFDQTYLIITDNFRKIRKFDIIQKILDNKENCGFSLFCLDSKVSNLSDRSTTFIQLNRSGTGELCVSVSLDDNVNFEADFKTRIDYDKCVKTLANIPIEFTNSDEGQIPSKIGFLEMYDVGEIEQLNSRIRWKNNSPMLSLQAPIGIGKSGEKINIDLHEKYHGPHGLVAGMTGSGKSEFLITYILSMAVNYHPYEVQFILIDYKGGGLAGAFENKTTGLKLPHLVGTITNLDANEIKRSLMSIESELKRRQALFNEAREVSGESTIDIYKYQKMYRDCMVKEPVSHLFIISDEFAELKSQQPEFMEQLISTARIGRSLGVHLILATQKPSGVVDPQIWSNTRFRICMRVQDKTDSNEVIKCPDAAYLKETGRFYFQVGYNEVFTLGQAAWAGCKYIPSKTVNKTIDTSINFINNVGNIIKSVETHEKSNISMVSYGEELTNLVKYLSKCAEESGINCKPLWLERIPAFITVDNLFRKYNYQKLSFNINPIIGEYDIPSNQEQCLLTMPITNEGNAIIYGASGSGKENLLTTILYSSMMLYSPQEVNYYIIDFGSGSLKMFNNSSIVGDILYADDKDKIENLYKMLFSIVESRKELFADYNGDYLTYCRNSGSTVPNIVILINNYELYQETYNEFDDSLNSLTRECNKYGIYFVITVNTPNGIRFKLKQNFSLIYSLQQNNDDDYITVLGNVYKNYPSKLFGRGITKINDDIYEFQTAFVTEQDNIGKLVSLRCDEINEKIVSRALKVPVLPDVVSYNEISSEFAKDDKLIIGIEKSTLDINKFDFNRNFATVVSSLDLNSSSDFINPLINQIVATNKSSLIVINAEEYFIDDKYKKYYKYVDNNFNVIFNDLLNYIKEKHDLYVNNNYDKTVFNDVKAITCIIIGIELFKTRLSDDNKLKFDELFKSSKDLDIINFILVDGIDSIKKIELEPWYKNSVNNTSGIWIGNGINDQFSIKVSQKIAEMKSDIPNGFCFVVQRGKPIYVKYVQKLDLKD